MAKRVAVVSSSYRRKLVYTDFYEAYARFFSLWQHRPCDKGSGKTSVIEGLNNKWRNRISGWVRKTVCVQHLDELERRLWLATTKHNLEQIRQLEKLVLERNKGQYPLPLSHIFQNGMSDCDSCDSATGGTERVLPA